MEAIPLLIEMVKGDSLLFSGSLSLVEFSGFSNLFKYTVDTSSLTFSKILFWVRLLFSGNENVLYR
jgi:hypothetical protein